MKKICVITGSRSEYGLLRSLMFKIKDSKELVLQLVVSGMHFIKELGETIEVIKKDGLKIDYKVNSHIPGDEGWYMALSVSKGIDGFVRAFRKLGPDIVLILGDRVEVLSAAIAAMYMNIPIAHIHGGDVGAGCLDNQVRDAVTKLSNIHFVASQKSFDRVISLGEERWRVVKTGAPGIDQIITSDFIPKDRLFEKYGLDPHKQVLLVVQHPVTTEIEMAGKQMHETLKAVMSLEGQILVIYPNSDAGSASMIDVIKKHSKHKKKIKTVPNMQRIEYLSFLKYSSVLVGNSSSGVIETAFFKIPVVNIGIRQKGRERSCNVIDAPHEKTAIAKAIKKALNDSAFRKKIAKCKNPYGNGRASEKIIKSITKLKIDKRLLQKQIIVK